MSSSARKPWIRKGSCLSLRVVDEEAVSSCNLEVTVDDVTGGLFWIKGSYAALRPGDEVVIEQPVTGDARYVQPAEVEVVAPDRFALRVFAQPQRLQQRAHVRVSTDGLHLRISRPEREETEPSPRRRRRKAAGADLDDRFAMLDLSAGGLRLRGDGSFRVGSRLVCHFELSGASCFALPGRVASVESPVEGDGAGRWVGVEFLDLDEDNRSTLQVWVLYEQLRQHHRARGHRRSRRRRSSS